MNLADILKDSNYKLSQFTVAEIEQLEQSINLKATKSGEVPYIVCLVRQNPHSGQIKENLGIKNSQKEKPEKIA
ncbi:hypothetical protein [Nostoc sp.]